jgi:DNA-binding MarR family transcriptional regulator
MMRQKADRPQSALAKSPDPCADVRRPRAQRLYPSRVSSGPAAASPVAIAGGNDDDRHPGCAAAVAQPGPPIDVARLRVAIARLSRRLRKHDLAGLTQTQLSALSTVDKSGPLRLGDLAAAERIAPSTLTRLVSALEERGYVQRCAVPGDARASTLAITGQGHAVLERIRQETTSLLRESLLMLPPAQLAALAAALPALEHLADADPGDPRSR